ncbi:protein phosphatase 2C domain-containing protein [Streptomyces sp. NPDC041068]|uniref:protein phosphatase 2C domain-containing protein n=1 Tax=Streptomyces sp. NPDC041068 TaxID=3155130 RepID=UPI0033EA3626
MSQQGDRHTGRDDDWWGQLYDDSTQDTGPTPAPDTLDDRFASASNTVKEGFPTPRNPTTAQDSGAEGPAEPPAERWGTSGEETAPAPPPAPGPAVAGLPPAALPASGSFAGADGGLGGMVEPHASAGPYVSAPAGVVPAGPAPVAGPSPWEVPTAPGGPVTFGTGTGTAGEPGGYSTPSTEEPRGAVPTSRGPERSTAPPGGRPEEAGARGPAAEGSPPAPLAYVGDGPPTYEAEPTVLPAADPDNLDDLVADTVLDGARYGSCTLRAVSVRGDSARYRGEPRRDSLLTARFGTGGNALVLVAMATGTRATPGAHRAAAEACEWIGRAVGRSHRRLAEDIRAARRGDLKSGLHRLTDRSLGKLRAHAADLGLEPEEYAASLRCLLLPADPECRTRVFFGVGSGGLFRLRDGEWQDIEPRVADATGDAVVGFGSLPAESRDGDRLTMDLGITTPPSPYEPAPEPPRDPFRFRASVARPGDTLVLCSGGLAEPLRGEPELAEHLTRRWEKSDPPGLAAFLADIQVRVKGYADDRTAAAVWEA